MDEIIKCVEADIEFIRNKADNLYILKSCDILAIKLQDIKERKYKTEEVVYGFCDKMINYDIHNMRSVPELSDELYAKIDELTIHVEKIKAAYFE